MKKQEIIEKLKEGYSVRFKDEPDSFYTLSDNRLYYMMIGEPSLCLGWWAIGDWDDEEIEFWR